MVRETSTSFLSCQLLPFNQIFNGSSCLWRLGFFWYTTGTWNNGERNSYLFSPCQLFPLWSNFPTWVLCQKYAESRLFASGVHVCLDIEWAMWRWWQHPVDNPVPWGALECFQQEDQYTPCSKKRDGVGEVGADWPAQLLQFPSNVRWQSSVSDMSEGTCLPDKTKHDHIINA